MTVRLILVAIASILLGVQIIRNAAVASLSAARPAEAAELWPGHPSVEAATTKMEIAAAGVSRRAISPSLYAMIDDSAVKAPLAPEPFLVRGTQAELSGDKETAQRAFEAAQWRDPNSLVAAYFLADRYFRTGNVDRCLGEIALLVRLSSNNNPIVAPYVAAYAMDRSNWPALQRMFRANPAFAHSELIGLASNSATAPAVQELVDSKNAQNSAWLVKLLNALTSVGEYQEARTIWERLSSTKSRGLLYDAEFRDKSAPAPFNWSLTSSSVGVSERQGGRLHLVFYGQEDGILASELLLLKPGRYHLTMQLFGELAQAHSLTWSIWCDKVEIPFASVSLDVAASHGWSFTLPPNCPAQSLRLSGMSLNIPRQVDLSIGALKPEKVDARG